MKFSLIMADPPWMWAARSIKGEGRSPKYDKMTDDEIRSLDVKSIAEKDALLFLWITMPKLLLAESVIKAWGFTYATCFYTLIKLDKTGKPKIGNGYYTRANAELCLVAKRGKGVPRVDRAVSQILMEKGLANSEKPLSAYTGIDLAYPQGNRITLFERKQVNGWVCLGNEISGKDIREELIEWQKKQHGN